MNQSIAFISISDSWARFVESRGYHGDRAPQLLDILDEYMIRKGGDAFVDMLWELSDQLDESLHRYSQVPVEEWAFTPAHFQLISRLALPLEAAILWSCADAMASGRQLPPSAALSGHVLHDFTRVCAGDIRNGHLAGILDALDFDPLADPRWRDAVECVEVEVTSGRWPSAVVCQSLVELLDALALPWQRAVESMLPRVSARERQKLGYQRAARWLLVHRELFRCLAIEDGPVRVLASDMFAILRHFRRVVANAQYGNQGAVEILLRDVIAPIMGFMTPGLGLQRMPVNCSNRRQRLTRSRATCLKCWHPAFADDEWVNSSREQLLRLHAHTAPASGP